MNATTTPETVQVGDSRYERPFTTARGLMVTVHEPDGDRYTTYGVSESVVDAWASHDASGSIPGRPDA